MLTITSESHLDHDLTLGHLRLILERFGARDQFFAESIPLPETLPPLPCALRGPAVGLDPVPNAHVTLHPRPGRSYPSRLLRRPALDLTQIGAPLHYGEEALSELWTPLLVRTLTVIAGPGLGLPCVLYTAFGGPMAPREPGDPSLPEAERAASEAFWAEHALVP
jgi:hypothetical protein